MMPNLTDLILNSTTADERADAFAAGVASEQAPLAGTDALKGHRSVWRSVRSRHGFMPLDVPLLTPPSANAKLNKGTRPAYGLTLQHHVSSVPREGRRNLIVNACPSAGHCTKVCVLDNGNGGFPAVQRARLAKTELFATHPLTGLFLLGHELAKAESKHDQGIDFRPNVNSDVRWDLIAPNMLDGSLLPSVWGYGYTKVPFVLDTDGWVLPRYRVAFSASEALGIENQMVWNFIARGGSVAVVTNRKPKTDIEQWAPRAWASDVAGGTTVMDADLTDEWIFESSVIGDLSAKGKARKLIGKSGFITCAY